MTTDQARTLKIGRTVHWGNESPPIVGTITRTSPRGLQIHWNDDKSGWLDFANCEELTTLPPPPNPPPMKNNPK